MPLYLGAFSQTPETWAKLIKAPEDRREHVRSVVEAVGGMMHGYWYSFGKYDGYTLLEFPDNVTEAAVTATAAASGRFQSVETTVLLSVEEMLEVLQKARDVVYRPPGG